MSRIDAVKAREFPDSRGSPTVEVEVQLSGGPWAEQQFLRKHPPEIERPRNSERGYPKVPGRGSFTA